MFRFTRKPSSGSHSQYLAKITLVQCEYMEDVQTFSVLRLHSMTCTACVQSITLTLPVHRPYIHIAPM
jgi:hypothetical protein